MRVGGGRASMEIYHSYTKLRKEFGRHCAFHDEAGEARTGEG